MYADTKYITGLAQEKLLKEFKKVILTRDSSKIGKALYNFLHCNIGFIAHYNIHGFRETYSGLDFREFVEHFDLLHANRYPWLLGRNSDYCELIKDMANFTTAQASTIYMELSDRQRGAEIKYANMLLIKHGVTVPVESEEVVVQESFFAIKHEESGQLAMGF